MSAAAVASTTVESATAATMESTATAAVESSAAVKATMVTATDKASGIAAPVAVIAASVVAAVSIVTVAVVTAAAVEAVAIVAAVEPRTGADEDAADEVVRPVVAVRSAGVRIVAVVTISAGGCRPDGAVHGTYSDAHGKLCVSVSRGKKQDSQQSNIF
jgi:hypothetical protein